MAGTNTTPESLHASAAPNKMKWLDAINLTEVTHATFRVAYTIASHANWDASGPGGWSCWPGLGTITKEAGCSRQTAVSAIAELRSRGLLTTKTGGVIDGENVSTRYGFTMGWSNDWTTVVQSEHHGGSNDWTQPASLTNSNNQLPSEAAHDAPSSHLADSDLSVATTRSAVQHEGHGEGEHDEQDELSSGTSGDAVPPVAASASKEQAKEGEVDPRRLNGRALLAHRWGEDATTRAVQLSMQCAGGVMSEELFDLLADVDDEFADWCSDYGSRIASRAACSEREAAGILASKLRTFDRGMWLAA